MGPKKILIHADKTKDPIGVIAVAILYFANRIWQFDMTTDDILLATMLAGALRTFWDNYKHKILKEESEGSSK